MADQQVSNPKGESLDPKKRYAHRKVYVARRASLIFWCVGAGLFLWLTVFPVVAGFIGNWLAILPLVFVVMFLTLGIPPTEEWEYTPWQAEPERYEHYSRD